MCPLRSVNLTAFVSRLSRICWNALRVRPRYDRAVASTVFVLQLLRAHLGRDERVGRARHIVHHHGAQGVGAEHVELRLIRPKYDAARANPVNALGCVVEQVAQLTLDLGRSAVCMRRCSATNALSRRSISSQCASSVSSARARCCNTLIWSARSSSAASVNRSVGSTCECQQQLEESVGVG